METICSQTSQCVLTSFLCFVYDFQTLLTGAVAIIVAIIAGIPVWRQLKDTNLQTRISHRETLANLLRDALRRYEKVDQAIREPFSMASRMTSDPTGEPITISSHDAFHLDQMFDGVLEWYLVILADTEHRDIEAHKLALRSALARLMDTLNDSHWADHNEQQDEDHNIPDAEWARILDRCEEAKNEVLKRVSDAQAAYRALREAQEKWVRSLRGQIAKLDLQIARPQ